MFRVVPTLVVAAVVAPVPESVRLPSVQKAPKVFVAAPLTVVAPMA